MEYFAKTVNRLGSLFIFGKISILDIWQGSKYAFGCVKTIETIFVLKNVLENA